MLGLCLARSISERAADVVTVKPYLLRDVGGVISFTFDDFPRSALVVGGEILTRYQCAGTYYVAGGLTGTSQHGLCIHSADDIKLALQQGHEVGSQGYAHINYSRLTPKQTDVDVVENQRFLAEIIGYAPVSFSYPFGARLISTKRQVSSHFRTARGIVRGINRKFCDLSDLRAIAIYANRVTDRQIDALIEETAAKGGWLIFYTHDVSDTPTEWGTTPTLLEHAIRTASASGCRILPVHKAITSMSWKGLNPSSSAPINKYDSFSLHEADDHATTVIAIVAFGNSDDVVACLAALANSTEKNYLISICENGEHLAYRALIERLSGLIEFDNSLVEFEDRRISEACAGRLKPGGQVVRIFRAVENLGYAGGVNLSVNLLGLDVRWSALWILNPDTEPEPTALKALIERARNGQYSLVSSRLVSKITQRVQAYGSRWRPFIARGFNIGRNAPRDLVPNIEHIESTMSYVSGASLFVTREYVESVGLMDERYFLYCEEVDWCLRRGGHRLGYAHDAVVRHAYGTTIGSNVDRKRRSMLSVYLDERNKLLLTRRFFPAFYPLVALITLLLTLQYLGSGAISNFVVALNGWLAGLRGEEGAPNQLLSKIVEKA
jgi:N-acetylglucosaminyl-diphospho-decaprenol L-rhamnosyltransferase